MFLAQGISPSLLVFPLFLYRWKGSKKFAPQEIVIIFSWSIHGLSIIEVDVFDKEFLHKKIKNKDVCMWIMLCCREDIAESACSFKRAFRHYGDLTAFN